MSPLSKKLLKIIMIVLVIDLVIAAIPVAQVIFHSLVFTPAPLPAPVVYSPSAVPPAMVVAGPTAASPVVTVPVVLPSLTATLLAPVATPALEPPNSSPAALASSPIRLPGRTDNYPNTYLLMSIFRPGAYAYQAQPGTPILIQNFAHADAGCGWMSVAGQVLDASGNPVKSLVVEIAGTLDGKPVELMGLTGLAPAYGPGGFEIQLSGMPSASTAALTIQIFDLSGSPLTEPVPFDTSASCSENVVLINFAP
jgi:hypothetical protein